MKNLEPARILIVDDHPAWAKGLKALLLAEAPEGSQRIEIAKDALEAMIACEALEPHLVLMDIRLPGRSGIEATSDIKMLYPTMVVVMLTISEEEEDLMAALKAGASGYLLKDMDVEELAVSIRSILEGNLVIPAHLATRIGEYLHAPADPPHAKLTDFEEIVLQFVARAIPNDKIAEELGTEVEDVSNWISSIYTKLHITTRVEAAAEAIRRGLV
ncbi:MAG: response regulator [Actinomycetota bacterium]|nr:response regulator transcription factor [Actinomycetota bacterium]